MSIQLTLKYKLQQKSIVPKYGYYTMSNVAFSSSRHTVTPKNVFKSALHLQCQKFSKEWTLQYMFQQHSDTVAKNHQMFSMYCQKNSGLYNNQVQIVSNLYHYNSDMSYVKNVSKGLGPCNLSSYPYWPHDRMGNKNPQAFCVRPVYKSVFEMSSRIQHKSKIHYTQRQQKHIYSMTTGLV